MINQAKNIYRTVKYIHRTLGPSGLSCYFKAKLSKSPTLFEKNVHNVKYPISLRIRTLDVYIYQEVFIDEQYDFQLKKEPQIIVDAGANIGLASIYFANKYPNATIIAIEPENSNFEMLKKNVAPYEKIVPIQAALWNESGELNLVDPGLGNLGFRTQADNATSNSFVEVNHKVKALTVIDILENYGFEKIDIFKIDIEGAEKEVFSDSSLWIDKVNVLIVELHENLRPGCNRAFYNGTVGFDTEWQHWENMCLSRDGYLISENGKVS